VAEAVVGSFGAGKFPKPQAATATVTQIFDNQNIKEVLTLWYSDHFETNLSCRNKSFTSKLATLAI